jgi:hypothetical protein
MPSLKDATTRPNNVGEVIPPATPYAQNVPPIIPREQPGLGPASLGPAPSLWTTGYDSVRQWTRPGTSQGRFPTLPTKVNPQLNAAARSVATTIIKNIPAPAASGVTSVGLSMPRIFTVSGSPVTSTGTLAAALTSEPLGTFFAAPIAGLSALEALSASTLVVAVGTGTLTETATPTTATSWGLYAASLGSLNTFVNPSGWTPFSPNPSTSANFGSFTKSLTGTSPVSVSEPINDTGAAMLAIFSGALPATIQENSSQPTPGTSATLAFASSNTSGNTIIVIVMAEASGNNPPFSLSASDSLGNQYTILSNQQVNSGFTSASLYVAIAPNCLSGPNTITAQLNGKFGAGPALIQIIEIGPLAAGPGIPIFRPLTPSDIPPISLASFGNGGTTGILPGRKGGTGLDSSTTGGAGRFLKQNALGGAFTVVQPSSSDLTDGTTGTGAIVLATSPTLTTPKWTATTVAALPR